MLYLSIFILSRRRKIKFHCDCPSRKSIWTNLDPKSSIFDFFAIFGPIFFPSFVPLAGNLVLCQSHSIAHVHALYFLVKADLSDLTRGDKMDPGQNGSGNFGPIFFPSFGPIFFPSLWWSPFSCPLC